MQGISIEHNPYEHLYRTAKLSGGNISKGQAEELVRHLGLIYNTFGIAMKDFIKFVATTFEEQSESTSGTALKQSKKRKEEEAFTNFDKTQKEINIFVKTEPKIEIIEPKREEEPVRLSKGSSEELKKDDWLQQFEWQNSNQQRVTKKSQQHNRSKQFKKTPETSRFFNQFQKDSSNSNSFSLSLKQPQRQKMIVIDQEDDIPEQSASKTYFPKETARTGCFYDEDGQFGFRKKNNAEPLRVIAGRKKKERQQIPRIACSQCNRYYQAMGLQNAELCECSSRHRSNVSLRRYEKKNFTQEMGFD